MSVRLDKALRREVEIDGEMYTLTIGPDGLRLTRKRARSGLAISWRALLRLNDSSPGSVAGPPATPAA
jgi:hypothetical protein